MIDITRRHPATVHLAQFFEFGHLVDSAAREVSAQFKALAFGLIEFADDGPELTACLRKLVEAKDCAVRAVIYQPGE